MRAFAFEYSFVFVKDKPGTRLESIFDCLSRSADDVCGGHIACIYGIESLLLLSGIAAVVVTALPIYIGRRLACETAPSPEIDSCKKTALAC